MLLGFGLAILVGVPFGLLLGSFRSVDFVVRPYVNVLFVTSLSAILPLLILFFGTGFEFRVAVVFLFAVFYVIINPANGVRSIDANIVDMAEAFGARPLKRFFAITMPGTLPFIISGVRLGLGQAVQGMIIAELWITIGTGRALKALSMEHALGEFFALAAIVVLVGTVLAQLVLWLQRRITPWAGDTAKTLQGGN
jgi:NitT/TauT family transport system permease protein